MTASGSVSPRSPPPQPHTPSQQVSLDPDVEPTSTPNTSDDETTEPARRPRIGLYSEEELSHSRNENHLPLRPRTTKPTSHPNEYLHPTARATSVPEMQRAYSTPGVDSSGRFIQPTNSVPRRPSSPLSAGRRRSPMRMAFEETFPSSYSGLSIEPNIPEHAELELSSPITSEDNLGPLAPMPAYSNTLPRSRRRPTSPLHQSASAPSLHTRSASPHFSGGVSPSLSASRFANEMYPSYSSASSMPSTPTSFRSRSPSISSLETIEDIPDAEEAAMLEVEESKARGDDSDGTSESRRRSLDLRGSGLRSNKERKRWSVCGAERRADFSLEPIEE